MTCRHREGETEKEVVKFCRAVTILLITVYCVNKTPQHSKVFAVEVNNEARKVRDFWLVVFFWQRSG
jgi:hypothetical protein